MSEKIGAEDVADRMRAGEIPPEVQEFFARTAREWHVLASAVGKEGMLGPGSHSDS
jgi:hypothetical protein